MTDPIMNEYVVVFIGERQANGNFSYHNTIHPLIGGGYVGGVDDYDNETDLIQKANRGLPDGDKLSEESIPLIQKSGGLQKTVNLTPNQARALGYPA